MPLITNINEAKAELTRLIQTRGGSIEKTEDLTLRKRYGNFRFFTKEGEVFHLKFSKQLFQPRENVVGGAADLDNKLKFATKHFGNGDNSLNGIDEDLLVELLELEANGYQTYFVTVMSDGRVLWRTGREAYEFVQRYDTIAHYPRSYSQPICYIPTGWLVNRSNIISNPPTLLK